MESMYPLIISFLLIFLSELGDKTQILVLSFSSKTKVATVLLGVALGSFFSHGLAIIFGSTIVSSSSFFLNHVLGLITYISFILIGLFSLFSKKGDSGSSNTVLSKISKFKLNYILIIATSIAVGEIGDKTFLASIGLGIEYSHAKFMLILGAILGMCTSNLLAIILGKVLTTHISENSMQKLSGILFLMFGILGLIRIF